MTTRGLPGKIEKTQGDGDILMIQKKDFSQVKRDIETCVGERIRLKANKGRRRIIEQEGVIEKSYPCVFVIRFDNEFEYARRISYSYTDVLTKSVEIVLLRTNRRINIC